VSGPGERAQVWEEPLPTLTGRAWAFGTVLALGDVLAARHSSLAPEEARRHVFEALDGALVGRFASGDVIAVEEVHGTARDARALAALRHAGIAAIVARRYEPKLEEAALGAGIVPVTLDAPAFVRTGDRVRIDLEAAKLVNLSSGDRAAIRNLDEARRTALRAMLLASAGA
jgi:3-isopropylmalate dehydratase small subunit